MTKEEHDELFENANHERDMYGVAYRLWREYFIKTEQFDRQICGAVAVDGTAIPTSAAQTSACLRNATVWRRDLEFKRQQWALANQPIPEYIWAEAKEDVVANTLETLLEEVEREKAAS